MTKEEIISTIKEQLALEFNCTPDDFSRKETVITRPVLQEKRRKFNEKPFFLQMATFGRNAVISADERLHPWLEDWIREKPGFQLFEQPKAFDLDRELRKYGYSLAPTHHMFAPLPERTEVRTNLRIKWLEREVFSEFYGRKEFSNALCDRFRPDRPDVLAVVALDGDQIMGMAGASADTPVLWQIGIDVLPQYRGLGIGTALVTLLRNEALERAAIPYYGTSLSNLPSWKIALASGFVPAWIETETTVCAGASL